MTLQRLAAELKKRKRKIMIAHHLPFKSHLNITSLDWPLTTKVICYGKVQKTPFLA